MPANQKIEPLFRAALNSTPEELAKSPELSTGLDAAQDLWEVIIKYTGDLKQLTGQFPDITAVPLLNGYGILTVPAEEIDAVSSSPIVTYMEKPKRFFFETDEARSASCIASLQPPGSSAFSGRGTLVGIIDSGIDYAHPDFRAADGTSRILALWDQTVAPDASRGRFSPEGYALGTLFSREQINEALKAPAGRQRDALCPSFDPSGHGTHVAGIAAGNGAASDGRYRGVAYEASLLIVKLKTPDPSGFPSTSQLMQAVDFCIRTAVSLSLPLAINLSFGNSYGSHSGSSLIETYLDSAAQNGRCCIVVGSGNEGFGGGHTGGRLLGSESRRVEFTVAGYSASLSIQLWKNYGDEIRLTITAPRQNLTVPIAAVPGTSRYRLGGTELMVYYGEPSPYSPYQEIYLDLIPAGSYLDEGVWTITLSAQRIIDGVWDMWMPSAAVRNAATRFLLPTPDITLTIPSTARHVITVGAYDSRQDSFAAFSGRGPTWQTNMQKPDLAAPGVDITGCAPGGGYAVRTGTSMAAPFVTGSCAALMQWGIVDENDPFLYGEKIKAYLQKGARRLPAFPEYPNPQIGWGALCLKNSLPDFVSYN